MKLPIQYLWQEAREPSKWLMVVLHGRGDSAEGFEWLQEELAIDSLNLLPVETTQAQIQMLQKFGFKIDYREYPKSHTIDPKRELSEIRSWLKAIVRS
jgi:predicted esterase